MVVVAGHDNHRHVGRHRSAHLGVAHAAEGRGFLRYPSQRLVSQPAPAPQSQIPPDCPGIAHRHTR